MSCKLLLYLIVTLPLLGTCGEMNSEGNMQIEREAIAESVFAYEINHQLSIAGNVIYFLYMGNDEDPTPDLLNRLRQSGYSVKPASKARVIVGRVEDKETKQPGVLIGIRDIRCDAKDRCEAKGRVFRNSDNTEGWIYQLVKEDKTWRVKKAEMFSVS